MRFDGVLEIAAARDSVWRFLTDPQALGACAPEVKSVTVLDPRHFTVLAKAGVGPVRATFTFDVRFAELRPNEHAELVARGRAPGSAVEMRSAMDLSDAGPDATMMRWSSDVTVVGLLASVGARLVEGTAEKMMQQVFARIRQELERPPSPLG